MSTTTTRKLYFKVKTDYNKDRTISFGFIRTSIPESTINTIKAALVTNSDVFKNGYKPVSISEAWIQTETKSYYDS